MQQDLLCPYGTTVITVCIFHNIALYALNILIKTQLQFDDYGELSIALLKT